nr:PREDICTED: uncharacterized protein LOC107077441 [Lepisosteus oculatus]
MGRVGNRDTDWTAEVTPAGSFQHLRITSGVPASFSAGLCRREEGRCVPVAPVHSASLDSSSNATELRMTLSSPGPWLCVQDKSEMLLLNSADCPEKSSQIQYIPDLQGLSPTDRLLRELRRLGGEQVPVLRMLKDQSKVTAAESSFSVAYRRGVLGEDTAVPLQLGLMALATLILSFSATLLLFLGYLGVRRRLSGPVWQHKPVLLVSSSDSEPQVSAVCALASLLQRELCCEVQLSHWAQGALAQLGPVPWLYGQREAVRRAEGRVLIAWSPEGREVYQRWRGGRAGGEGGGGREGERSSRRQEEETEGEERRRKERGATSGKSEQERRRRTGKEEEGAGSEEAKGGGPESGGRVEALCGKRGGGGERDQAGALLLHQPGAPGRPGLSAERAGRRWRWGVCPGVFHGALPQSGHTPETQRAPPLPAAPRFRETGGGAAGGQRGLPALLGPAPDQDPGTQTGVPAGGVAVVSLAEGEEEELTPVNRRTSSGCHGDRRRGPDWQWGGASSTRGRGQRDSVVAVVWAPLPECFCTGPLQQDPTTSAD